MDRGAWLATFHGIAELDTTEQLTLSCHPNKSNPITALTGGSSGVGLSSGCGRQGSTRTEHLPDASLTGVQVEGRSAVCKATARTEWFL